MSRFRDFLIRTFAFVRKELLETLRQPRLVALLVLGPFLILLIFGVGYTNENRILRTFIVVPADSVIREEIEAFAERLPGLNLLGFLESEDEADSRLLSGEADLVIITPPDPLADVLAGERAAITFQHREIDPIERIYVRTLEREYVNAINREVLARAAIKGKAQLADSEPAVAQGLLDASRLQRDLRQGDVVDAASDLQALGNDIRLLTASIGAGAITFESVQALEEPDTGGLTAIQDSVAKLNTLVDSIGLSEETDEALAAQADQVEEIRQELSRIQGLLERVDELEPTVVARPFEGEAVNLGGVTLGPIDYFVPGTISLLLQHIAVTLAALSLVRERRGGSIELFRAAPLSALEALLGKSISFLLMGIVLAAVLSALVVFGLRTPMQGSWIDYSIVVLVLLYGSLGLGFFISSISETDTQAVQYSMIVLLASIFFTGFFIALHRLAAPVYVVSALLPATWGTASLQRIMLRGESFASLDVFAALFFGFVAYLLAWWRVRRQMRSV